MVLAIDAKARGDGSFEVYVSGVPHAHGHRRFGWAAEAERLGAGEILLTSMDRDGTKDGFDLKLTKGMVETVGIPVASGGCGKLEHFAEVFRERKRTAALAASLFHFGELTVPQVKDYLRTQRIPVRR